MRATTEDWILLRRLDDYFVARALIAPTTDDVSAHEVEMLLDSPIPDVSLAGTYVLSQMRRRIDRRLLARRERSALNYAHYVMSLHSDEEAMTRLTQTFSTDSLVMHQARSILEGAAPGTDIKPQPHRQSVTQQSMTIIVHGTGARKYTWWKYGGNFFSYVDAITHDVYGAQDQFYWSGADRHSRRARAAKQLKDWIDAHPSPFLRVIAHSHGGNVALVATQLGARIDHLILLGTPIRLEYLPAMRNIRRIDNIFATSDHIQSMGTFPHRRGEGRTLGDRVSTENLRAVNDGYGRRPGHSDLHEPSLWTAEKLDRLL